MAPCGLHFQTRVIHRIQHIPCHRDSARVGSTVRDAISSDSQEPSSVDHERFPEHVQVTLPA